jgi:hypothetical protein
MTRLTWWLVDRVSLVLEPDERSVVRGDFAELRKTGRQALCELLGLVGRRQLTPWRDWGTWVALVGAALPLGLILGLVSRSWAEGSAIDAVVWVHYGQWSYLSNPGWRNDLVRVGVKRFLNCAALVGWSSTCGFVLGSLSRRAIWVNGILFGAGLFGATLGTNTAARTWNPSVFSMPFYSVLFPVMFRIALVVLPALWGIRLGLRPDPLPLRRVVLSALALAALTAAVTRGLQGSVIYSGWWPWLPVEPGADGVRGTDDDPRSWPLQLLPLLVSWPLAYIVATSWRRSRTKAALA